MSDPVVVLGGGCTGPLLGLLLARRGHTVRLYERRADARRVSLPAGRSINLALAARGIAALERAGVMAAVRPLLVPMRGRMVHDLAGEPRFLPYGQRPHELLYAVSRADLNRVLVDAAEDAGVEFHFEHACRGADFARGQVEIEDLAAGLRFELPLAPVLAADGSGSALRHAMVAAGLASAREETLAHRYKELTIPAGRDGRHPLPLGALHIWPRGGHMLIALPNVDGTFTATLFLPADGDPVSFAAVAEPAAARRLFERDFADVLALVPDLEAQYAANPVGRMSTIYAAPWHTGGRALLIGDAAHAIVPFHGQGMNCAFEDCRVLDDLLAATPDWETRFARFDALRREDTAAIARMAIENYTEMRDTVRDPSFALQKELSLELERRHPDRFIPRYSMVMFHSEIPYAEAERRGAIQARLLDAATRGCSRLADVDLPRLEAAIADQLAPITPPGASE
jgi:kynurenine 3-monooxygenase